MALEVGSVKAYAYMTALVWQAREAFQEKREHAPGLTEYSLLLVLMSIVSIGIMQTLGTTITNVLTSADAALQSGGALMLRP